MKLSDLMSLLQRLDIRLWVESDRLRYDAPTGALTDKLRAEIIKQKKDIIKLLRSSQKAKHANLTAIERVPRDQSIPLSFAQQRLWFLHQLVPVSYHYNILRVLSIKGPLNVKAVEQSLNQIICRHEALRTYFENADGQPVQKIHLKFKLKLTIIDLCTLKPQQREEEAMQIAKNEYLMPFDLSKVPLLRAKILHLDDNYHWFLLTIHHIVADGWSLGILFSELSSLYAQYSQGKPSDLQDLKIQYTDYAVWQRQWLSGDILKHQFDYWKKKLEGYSMLQLPTDRPHPAIQTFNGAHEMFECTEDLTLSLKELCQNEGVTLFMTLLSAFYILLYRYCGQEDIIVGSPIANRNRPEIEGLIGFFANTLPLRIKLSRNTSFRTLMHHVREMCLEAYEHQDLPFEKLVEELQPERDLSRNPIFQTMFVLINTPSYEFELSGLLLKPIIVENITAKFDLLLSIEERNDRLITVFEYNTDLYDIETIRRMTGHFNNILKGIIANPDRRISELTLITEDERKIILRDWNKTGHDYATDLVVHQIFEQQAACTPDSIAVIFEQQKLTYRQLNEASNYLAKELRTLGVGPDVPVGIMMERSLEMVLAILGTLKAGGAYVPLDPAYPADRLSFILKDTQAKILLTMRSLSDVLPPYDHHVLYLDGRTSQTTMLEKYNPVNNTSAQNAAYLIYTSGSTGQPKGIVMNHGALCNLIHWQLENTKIDAQARTLQFASLNFDVSFQEIFSTLCSGSTLVMISESLRRDIPGLLRFIEKMAVERIFVPYIVLQQLAEIAVIHNQIPRHLHEIITAGEQLHITSSIREMMQRLDHCNLVNQYGPSEAHVVTSYTLRGTPESWPKLPPIGRPIANVLIYILDHAMNPQPIGVPGELYIGGRCLSIGYLNRQELNKEKFVKNPFIRKPGAKLYRTGDLARYLPDGNIEFLGRIDNQVKIRGFRIELEEIESIIVQHQSVKETVVIAREDVSGDKQLVAYIVPCEDQTPLIGNLRDYLKRKLPDYMIPSNFMILDALPITPNRKIDRKALPAPKRERQVGAIYVAAQTDTQKRIADIWQKVLHLEKVGIHDNFFDLGGHSLSLVQVHTKLVKTFDYDISVIDLFQYPTIESLARYICCDKKEELPLNHIRYDKYATTRDSMKDVAIIGMAGYFPGAKDIEQFWSNIQDGIESIRFFSDEELIEAGVDPEILYDPAYIKASGYYEDVDKFDAYFFGYTPREAELIDPQQRMVLECAWEALESAGYVPSSKGARIGLYAGSSMNSYIINLKSNPDILKEVGGLQALISSDKDFLSTRVSYKLNLHGPSINVQTACSTSLVAVHEACKSLLNNECDIALAGGVRVSIPIKSGYIYHENGIMSPDGHCRTFDANAKGTVIGNGAGIIVLKRFDEALSEGDFIYAVIKGSAINNDGSSKVGYTAPSVDGQTEVIRSALNAADIDPRTINYIEAHGTGTELGDPIEVRALTHAFGSNNLDKGFCALGSIKTNIGHLDAAAGIAGLIKAAMALKHKQLPPSLHFQKPNPQINFESSPFYVNTSLCHWPEMKTPRRAGVSSFGIGGTNAHVILEEAPERQASGLSRPYQLLMMSAKTPSALERVTLNLANYLGKHYELNLADVAYTLHVGRQDFPYRCFFVCHEWNETIERLESNATSCVLHKKLETGERPVIFLFSGQGSQYPNMGLDLYNNETVFRSEMEQCQKLVQEFLGFDLLQLIYPPEDNQNLSSEQLKKTLVAQPALFSLEYALAKLWMSWGIKPTGMLGHSIGEYVAACLSGVFSLEDALALVCERGRLMSQLPRGSMLGVELSKVELSKMIRESLSIAAINAPKLCVVSGPEQEIKEFELKLIEKGLSPRRLHTSHAFHSLMMDPIIAPFTEKLKSVSINKPKIPYLSNVTGQWITDKDLMDTSYWTRHLRETVRFSQDLSQLLTIQGIVLLEVGPGNALCSLAKRNPKSSSAELILPSLRHPKFSASDEEFLMDCLGQLWLSGVEIDWPGFYGNENRHRVPLPTYPFERQRYWIDSKRNNTKPRQYAISKTSMSDWFYVPSWKRVSWPVAQLSIDKYWLLFMDDCGLGDTMADYLRGQGCEVVCVRTGEKFIRENKESFRISINSPDDYQYLLREMKSNGQIPIQIVHLWSVSEDKEFEWDKERSIHYQNLGFFSLVYLAQALGEIGFDDQVILTIVGSNVQNVYGHEFLCPEKSLLIGPCTVINQEFQHLRCIGVDVEIPSSHLWDQQLINHLLVECEGAGSDSVVAYRSQYRWAKTYEHLCLESSDKLPYRLEENGIYLITGGLGGIGSELASYLAQKVHAKLALVSRRELPNRAEWNDWLASHDEHDLISRRIKKILSLEASGAEVMAFSSEVEDEVRMQEIVEEILSRFGRINGVIHSAGIPAGKTIQLIESKAAQQVLSAKVIGTRVLEKVLSGLDLDFFVLCSSLASIQGGVGQVDYCSANAFLDAFAHYRTLTRKGCTISINWNAWKATGMAVDTEVPDYMKSSRKDQLQKLGISNEEGIEIFSRILSRCADPQVAVSREDLNGLFDYKGLWESSKQNVSESKEIKRKKLISLSTHPRPHLSTDYIQPRNEIEQLIADIWQKQLGIDRVGIYDNFFELGGDSLIAIQVIAKSRESNLKLTTAQLFKYQTIAELASQLNQACSQTKSGKRMKKNKTSSAK